MRFLIILDADYSIQVLHVNKRKLKLVQENQHPEKKFRMNINYMQTAFFLSHGFEYWKKFNRLLNKQKKGIFFPMKAREKTQKMRQYVYFLLKMLCYELDK